jgi:hypothetical protein
MKSKIESPANIYSGLPYPKLMEHVEGSVFLISEHGKGTLIHPTDTWVATHGCYCDNLSMDMFVDFRGTIKLSNYVIQ